MNSILNEWRDKYANEILAICDKIDAIVENTEPLPAENLREIDLLLNGEKDGNAKRATTLEISRHRAIFNLGEETFMISNANEESCRRTRKMTAAWRTQLGKQIIWHPRGPSQVTVREITMILTCLAHKGKERREDGGILYQCYEMDALTLHLLAVHANQLNQYSGLGPVEEMNEDDKGKIIFEMLNEIVSWKIPGLMQNGILLNIAEKTFGETRLKDDEIIISAEMPEALLDEDHSQKRVSQLVSIYGLACDSWIVRESQRYKAAPWESRESLKLKTNRYSKNMRRRITRE